MSPPSAHPYQRYRKRFVKERHVENIGWLAALRGHKSFISLLANTGPMKFTLPKNALPRVELSSQLQKAFMEEATTVVHDILPANEEFLAHGASFRGSKLRLVRAKDGVNVYHQTLARSSKRSGKSRSKSASAIAQPSPASASTDSVQENMCHSGGFHLVLHGTVDGNLDDCMLGSFAPTDQAWMWRSSHINDQLSDARILAKIRGPSRNDPFRFLGVKWFAQAIPAAFSGIVQRRDFLVLEATGLTRDSKGEKVGYFLVKSVSIPGVPEFSDIGLIRGELSLCFIHRQRPDGKVEMFCRAFTDMKGKMVDRVAVTIITDSLISVTSIIDYAHIKKLMWLKKHKANQVDTLKRDYDRQRGGELPTRCETCGKSFTKFTIGGIGSGVPCQICGFVVCGKCSVVKKITVDVSSTGSVTQCAVRVCVGCLLEAKTQSAWELVLDGVENSSEASSASGLAPSEALE